MSSFKYLEFEIQIQKVGTGRDYRAQVLNSPAGQGARDFTLPFSDLELENLFLKIGHARGIPSRGPNSPQVEAAKTFGQGLFTAIFEGDVLGCLRTSLDEATRQPDTGLRIRLRLKEVPELADLPWEFLYHTGLNRFLALSVETPVVRFLDLPQRIAPLAVTPPLRVLVMISDPIDQLRLKVEDEWKKLREALSDLERRGVVTLERLENGTLLALQQQLRRNEYHIFHYIGHGVFDPASKDGMLVLEDEQQRGRRVSGRDSGVILHDERTLRLAVLNACEGARAALADPFAGTAQSLVQQGIPSVIAMQFEISDEAAITFAREFYSVVATGSPVDAALSEARRAIFAKGNGLEWGTPVLYLRSADGRIFDFKSQPPPPPSDKVDILLRQARAARDSEDWTVALARGKRSWR